MKTIKEFFNRVYIISGIVGAIICYMIGPLISTSWNLAKILYGLLLCSLFFNFLKYSSTKDVFSEDLNFIETESYCNDITFIIKNNNSKRIENNTVLDIYYSDKKIDRYVFCVYVTNVQDGNVLIQSKRLYKIGNEDEEGNPDIIEKIINNNKTALKKVIVKFRYEKIS